VTVTLLKHGFSDSLTLRLSFDLTST